MSFSRLLVGLGAALCLIPPVVEVPAHAADPTIVYVSPSGNDAWSGRLGNANRRHSDGPVATLEHARNLLRALPSGAAKTLVLRSGIYALTAPLALTAADSGLTIRPQDGEKANLQGGVTVSGWKPVSDPAIRSRLDASARDKIVETDLKAAGIRDYGRLSPRGFGRPGAPAPLELFFEDAPMTLARWPNSVGGDTGPDTWATVASVPVAKEASRFTYTGARPSRWKAADDIYLHGYWAYDWADTYDQATASNPAAHEITLGPPALPFGILPGKRWYALNVLEELDAPGEYYVDRHSGMLYFYPPRSAAGGKTVVSIVEGPLLNIEGAMDVSISGLTLEDGRGDGIDIAKSTNVAVHGCTVRNMGRSGIMVVGGDHCAVRDCKLYALGEKGIGLSGGDRKTLARCNHEATGCDIHDYSRWVRTYQAGVDVDGVGICVANCHIHRAPHNGVLLHGNNNLVERNEIDHVCEETGDSGAFYMGRDWSARGNAVEGNWFHDMDGVRGQKGFTEVMAVYLDDCASGTLVDNNIFERIHGRAIMVGGGRDDRILNNLFVACQIAVHVDARAQGWAKEHAKKGGDWRLYELLDEVHYNQSPYSEAYPELATMLSGDPAFPAGTVVERNVVADIPAGGQWLVLQDGLTDKTIPIQNNLTSGETGVVVPAVGPAYLSPTSPALSQGINPIPTERIGLPRVNAKIQRPSADSVEVPNSLRGTAYDVTATVRVILRADGHTDVSLAKSTGFPEIDAAVVRACQKITFTPATEAGAPVDEEHEFEFKLQNKGN
jgi:TonB family protein